MAGRMRATLRSIPRYNPYFSSPEKGHSSGGPGTDAYCRLLYDALARSLRPLAEQRRAAQRPVLGRQQRRQAYLCTAANAFG